MIQKLFGYCLEQPAAGKIRLRLDHGRCKWAVYKPLCMPAAWWALALFLCLALAGRTPTAEVPAPTIDAALGPCSVGFTVTNQTFQPLYNAQIHAHFKYGLWGIKRMDLQIGTNYAGVARVKGLPTKLRNAPLDFVVTYGSVSQDWYWTGLDCNSRTKVALNVH